ncbi:GTP-binding protein TypA/BipA [Clostridium pasteurianum DSM 525 = ATCC 6013]|uniref:Large ribosomal subunit assembly factor BipA n=1 Tax=Clostridium pasteurianum DSM 525 = ATCC 6013 TaxID=1262449 RepID=A0A0H3J8G5_CLOPA|nr:translational GTPase TypA [Clostridium pasteurianum]AJA48213.1 GTP-binding protein TypA/BipA [Clostridium pasteurianum DSM 525 = ATCC 6013]AJA52201.1 GTP-binding protein TypA/BipA [Clostridium pasteurianum DSM 525 = ATCC 6013]AOZ75471.1 GTP-binding protein TypA [Clostridium pasteurianum DSM 525 = ATCC 6013]AOZ79266.1 GTP-binding protein TypA [Clostridium pasteurianum]ELP60635.1 GTP-binding protein TypA [Clostridium pasteurianum DSM 525 = ATCC 6013]
MELFTRSDIRNIAIIAHVDHGKTTLVDSLLKQSHVFRSNEKIQERVMDSNDLEKERGITILSKNTSVIHKGIKINIVDTPGHADFGGEVERVLKMVDSVLLLVDAFEGPMPQTKFVLKKALELGLRPIVVVNKIDKPNARPTEVIDEVFDLFVELGADDQQLEFPIIYASARDGIAKYEVEDDNDNMEPLFDTIIEHVKAPTGYLDAPFQMLVTTIDSNEYVGRIGIGKVERGRLKKNQQAALIRKDGTTENVKISSLYVYEGLKRVETDEVMIGDIAVVAGIQDVNIGETIADAANPEALPFVEIDEPTLSMYFIVNNSPFAGREGDFVTSRHIRDRLNKELETNVSLRVEETDSADSFKVSGRGELHLSILIETMRREGFEFQVSKPMVIYKEKDGKKLEPIENLTIDVPEEFMGVVMEKLGPRKAELKNMTSAINGYTRLEFRIPSRGLIGFRNEFMTDTKGNGIMNSVLDGYEQYKGEIPERSRGSLVVFEPGTAVTYGLYNAQERGKLFIEAGTEVYAGMIAGECSRAEDIDVNVCKKKHLSNTRSSGSDDALKLVPVGDMTLERCLEFIASDELVEITPKSIRMRKRILDSNLRKRASRNK